MSVVMLTSDLMFASRAEAAVKDLAVSLCVVGEAGGVMAACDDKNADVKLVIVDLDSVGMKLPELLAAVKSSRAPHPVVLAYGPHVQEDRLTAAKEAGCDQVVSRGQFNSQLKALLQQYAT